MSSSTRARLAAVVAVLGLAVAGCAGPAEADGAPAPVATDTGATPTPSPSPTDGPVESVRPASVYDIDCSAFAGAARIGTLAGVAPREAPDWMEAHFSRISPLTVVANAGGLACEFSDGGHWYDRGQAFALNVGWRGLSIYLVPGDVDEDAQSWETGCGDGTGRSYMTVCSFLTNAGPNSVYVVVAVNDRHSGTYQGVFDEVVRVASAAIPRAVERPARTFAPPLDCAALVSTDAAAAAFGSGPVFVDTIMPNDAPTLQAVAGGVQAGCDYWVDWLGSATVQVLPGGAWAMDARLAGVAWEAVEVAGLPAAIACEPPGAAEGNLNCLLELAVDGSWVEVSALLPTPGQARAAALGMAELVLAHRGR